jgi:hypothetical protein
MTEAEMELANATKRVVTYYEELLVEAKGVIAQLSGESSADFEYIHPYDLYFMVDKNTYFIGGNGEENFKSGIVEVLLDGGKIKRYKQTTLMPIKNKALIK